MFFVYDHYVMLHLKKFLKVGDKEIRLIGVSRGDSLQEGLLQSETEYVEFPMVGMVRVANIKITDNSQTKVGFTHVGYKVDTNKVTILDNATTVPTLPPMRLNSIRCSLSYEIVVTAPTRRMTEELAMQLYFKLRNNNQVAVETILPLVEEGVLLANSTADIVLTDSITQITTQEMEKTKLYMCKFDFSLNNCLIYDLAELMEYKLRYGLKGIFLDSNGKEIE